MADVQAGALRVDLMMNAGEFIRGAREAEGVLGGLQNKFAAFGAMISKWSGVVKAAIVAAIAGGVYAFQSMINSMDNLNKTSQKLGLPVDQLSQFAQAANNVNLPIELLAAGMRKLAKNMGELATGDMNQTGRVLASLGVSVTDASGKLRTTGDVIVDLAGKFSRIEDGAGKTAAAMAIFGKSGADIIPFLNQGADGIRRAADEAAAFGLVLDAQTGKAASAFNENMRSLGRAFEGVFAKIATEVLPVLVDFSNWLLEGVKKFHLVDEAANAILTGLRAVGVSLVAIRGAFDLVWTGITQGSKIAVDAFRLIPVALELAMQTAINAAIAGMEGVLNAIVGGLAKIGSAADYFTGAGLGEKIAQSLSVDMARINTDAMATQYEELQKRIATAADTMRASMAATVGDAQLQASAIWQGWITTTEEAAEKIPKATMPVLESQKALAEAQAELNKKIQEGIQLAKALETPRETELRQLAALEAAYKAGKIGAEAMGRAQAAAAYTAQNAYASLASNVMSALGKIFENNKAVAIATALVNTYEGVTKALASYPPPLSYVAAAAALAAGLAQVMNIKSTSKTSGGGGSSGSVGSGVSNGSFSGSGNMVGNTSAEAMPQLLTVRGITAGQLFSGEQVRELAAQLIKFQKDGGEVVIA